MPRMACATLSLDLEPGGISWPLTEAATADRPLSTAARSRADRKRRSVAPRLDQRTRELLHMDGREPDPAAARALTFIGSRSRPRHERSFTARVIASTRSDLAALSPAVGALKGPLHAGAPGADMLEDIGAGNAELCRRESRRTADWVSHRAPRSAIRAPRYWRGCRPHGERWLENRIVEWPTRRGDRGARAREHKPGRNLKTNVESHGPSAPVARTCRAELRPCSRAVGWPAGAHTSSSSTRRIT
jgi:citrate synthase